MEKNPKKSKALIITIILVLLLVIIGYFLFKNRENIGSKTSFGIAKIFSPLTTSENSKDLTTVNDGLSTMTAKAGEDINEGDSVYVSSLDSNNNPTVMKVRSGKYTVWGKALSKIKKGDYGNFTKRDIDTSLWGTVKKWVGNVVGNNSDDNENTCANGATNPTLCTINSDGDCINGANNPPLCTNFETNIFPTVTVTANPSSVVKGKSSTINWTSTNATSCNAGEGNGTGTTGSFSTGTLTKSKSFTVTCTGTNGTGSGNVTVSVTDENICTNLATNPPKCTTIDGKCINGATNPPDCTSNPNGECSNGADNYRECTIIDGKCINGATNPPDCTDFGNNIFPTITVTSTPATVEYNGVSTISWTSTNTISCEESSGRGGNLTTGTFDVGPLDKSTEYTVTCTGKEDTGQISGNAYVYVNPEIITLKPECSDGIDNDDEDTLADIDDPECHLGGILTNKYIANWYSEDIPASEITYQCNDGYDNDEDRKIDIEDPGCHTDGIALDKIKNGKETYNKSTYDPTRGEWDPIPTTGDGDKECNDGEDNDKDGGTDEGDLNCHVGGVITGKYIPTHDDESSTPTQCEDTIDNDGDDYIDSDDSGCHTNYEATDITDYDPTLNDESRAKETTDSDQNICLDIEQNPLTFTDAEKARLEILLRKFYLISSTLRTKEDIASIYSEIEQEKDFINQIEDLTKQCYLQINDTAGYTNFCARNPNLCSDGDTFAGSKYHDIYYTAGQNLILRRGNPWYMPSYETAGGTFPYSLIKNYSLNGEQYLNGYFDDNWLEGNYIDNGNGSYTNTPYSNGIGPGCKAVSGYYYGTVTTDDCPSGSLSVLCTPVGKDCDDYNDTGAKDANGTLKFNNCYYTNKKWQDTSTLPEDNILERGCKWKDGVDFNQTERILNIW